MGNIDDITKALAGKYSGIDLRKKKEEPKPAPREYDVGGGDSTFERDTIIRRTQADDGTPKLRPMEKMIVGDSDFKKVPKRPPVMMMAFTDTELEDMFATPARRGWDFETWLEVIGLPKDLHKKHDGVIYQYAARAFLTRKSEAHSR